MDLITFLAIGILIGFLTSLFVKVDGLTMTNDMAVAVAGALVGGFWFGSLHFGGANVIWQTVGASAIGALSFLTVTHIVIAATDRHRLQH